MKKPLPINRLKDKTTISSAEYKKIVKEKVDNQKFKNVKKTVDGHKFPSTIEADCYIYLKSIEKSNIIQGLVLQPPFPLYNSVCQPYYNGNKLLIDKTKQQGITYYSDFFFEYYFKKKEKYKVVVEVKGRKDQKYPLKKKMFLDQYGKEYLFLELHSRSEFPAIEHIIINLILDIKKHERGEDEKKQNRKK